MLKLKEIKRMMEGASIPHVARQIEIPYQRIYRVLRSPRPDYFLIEKLSDYFEDIIKEVQGGE